MAFQPNDDAAWISLLRQQMDEMFNYMSEQGCGRHEFSPNIDIYESANQYVIEVDLPGFSESDFTISITGSALRIDGVKRQEKTGVATSYICLERHFGRFSRSVDIPGTFDPDGIRTVYKRGVLVIWIAKR